MIVKIEVQQLSELSETVCQNYSISWLIFLTELIRPNAFEWISKILCRTKHNIDNLKNTKKYKKLKEESFKPKLNKYLKGDIAITYQINQLQKHLLQFIIKRSKCDLTDLPLIISYFQQLQSKLIGSYKLQNLKQQQKALQNQKKRQRRQSFLQKKVFNELEKINQQKEKQMNKENQNQIFKQDKMKQLNLSYIQKSFNFIVDSSFRRRSFFQEINVSNESKLRKTFKIFKATKELYQNQQKIARLLDLLKNIKIEHQQS